MKRFMVIGLALVFLTGCDFFRDDEIEGHEVLYYVTASAGDVAFQYADSSGALVQDTLTGLRWSHAFLAETAALELSAHNLTDTGLVRTFIFIDDEVVAADSITTDSTVASVQYDL